MGFNSGFKGLRNSIYIVIRQNMTYENKWLKFDARSLTHCGRVTQICVFALQLCRTGDADLRFNTLKLGTSASSP